MMMMIGVIPLDGWCFATFDKERKCTWHLSFLAYQKSSTLLIVLFHKYLTILLLFVIFLYVYFYIMCCCFLLLKNEFDLI